MVDLRVDGGTAALEPPDQVDLPQRAVPVQRASVYPRHLVLELARVARGRKRKLADVKLDVEVGILDPVGEVEPERCLDQAAPERWNERQPGLDQPGEALQRQRLRCRARVDDAHAADVAVDGSRLHREKGGVEPSQLLHPALPSVDGETATLSGHQRKAI